MTGELFIDTKDAYTEYGVTIMEGSKNALFQPVGMKEYVSNESRLEHGKHVIASNPKMESREITLTFGILGENISDFRTKKANFVAKLQKGEITLKIPNISTEVFHLVYMKSTTYAQNTKNTFCKIACKFIEPDPSKRL